MAANGEGDWELVVRSNKKGKNQTIVNGKLSRDEKREFFQKAPKATFNGAIEITPIGKENRKPKSPKAGPESKKKGEKKGNSASHQPRTLDEAVARLSVGEMQSLLDVVMSRFLDSPLIWLKDLASYLNVRVSPVKQPDPVFKGQDPSYPASRMSNKVKQLLLSTLSQCSDTVLASFHKHCITSMVQEQIKGLSVAGYKLFLQILSIHRPHVGVVHLQSYCELRQSIQNQTPTCLSLLWAVGQPGINNFGIGLRIWMELMVPLIGLKNYSAYVVDYGSDVFSGGGGGATKEYGDVLGVREFFSILDFTWCSSGSLAKPVQRQLFALYPKVKTTAFTSSPEVVLRNFFPSFLRRLNMDAPEQLKIELKTCLVQCLMQDPHCWNVWSQLYVKHLPQSAILLKHLVVEMDMLSQSSKTNKGEFPKMFKCFSETNKQMAHKIDSVPGLRDATEATNELLSHLRKVKTIKKSSGSRFWSILVVVLIVGIIWDIKSAGSFYGSKVGLILERVGLIPYVEDFGRSLRIATIQAYRWCVYNIPFYYSKGCDLAEPYLLLVWSWFEVAVAYFWAALDSIVEYIPIIKESIEKRLPGLSTSVIYYTNTMLQYGNTTVIAVKDAAMPYFLEVHNYVSTKVLIGALAPERLHEYVIGSIEYLRLLILRIHSTLMDNFEQDTENIVSKSSL
ncbi:LOW QUALITY PROTEIN: transmembrane protein 214-B [Palaemon carinicauda]|uniref:LOW QUALITY PROTEIN: transmembrane protein 214-B n=1 Tax=Palaemon carinicauda TaxID=392227 RepID=UPI0035B69FF4